ncbi:hypothetical protein LMH87_009308 [Akanthomyces muscarius]|uniref:Carboxylic ester hydrolase n=1 Tax=Akanthomyces muscarius TaxID=2231603 RepID=A0A9W8UKW3_AKAMU|nr:hypothetical protein LMH87_009308 [Akanthomyces muscarius]KAJ4152788.1 hypothetical protein LMH87_009308 [Akanthomyces muscarius]
MHLFSVMKFLHAQATMAGLLYYTPAAPAPELAPAFGPERAGLRLDERSIEITVNAPAGKITGRRSMLNIESFNAVPYAEPPVGPLRLKPPKRLSAPRVVDATGIAPACSQMLIPSNSKDALSKILGTVLDLPLLQTVTGQEDCLTVNVQRPAGTKAGAKLPVLFWIYGGAFQTGSTNIYDATSLLVNAVALSQPFVFVAVNYRLGGFGFLAGKEVLQDGSANLGLLDQRMGLEWVADNIAAFGGDPFKVTIWGESAGAISIFDQMILYGGNATYNGESLFRGAIMNSGSIVPADPVDCPKGQATYDAVVNSAGCSGAQDTLQCLRQADYKTFRNAVNAMPSVLSYSSVAPAYLPRPDGKVIPDTLERLIESGKFHAVPTIIGDQEDEGTLFSIFQYNVTTASDMTDYLSEVFFSNAPREQLKELVAFYEPPILEGSPFRTGLLNELYPGFKRVAAMIGDLTFTLTRRAVLSGMSKAKPDMPMWSYLSSYGYGTPFFGTFHGTDVLRVFLGLVPDNAMRSCRAYYFNFLYNQDPNKGTASYAKWPLWTESRDLMWFRTGWSNGIKKDDFRSQAGNWIEQNQEILHV